MCFTYCILLWPQFKTKTGNQAKPLITILAEQPFTRKHGLIMSYGEQHRSLPVPKNGKKKRETERRAVLHSNSDFRAAVQLIERLEQGIIQLKFGQIIEPSL